MSSSPRAGFGSARVPLGPLAFVSLLEAPAVPPLPSRAVTSRATRSLRERCPLGAPGPSAGLLSPFTLRSAVVPGIQVLTHVPGATASCFPPCALPVCARPRLGHLPPPPRPPWSRDRRQVVFTPSCLSTTGFAFLDCDCQLTCLPGHGHCRGTTESTHRVDTVIEACLGEEGRFHKAMKTWPHEG